MKVLVTQFVFDFLRSHGLQPARLLYPWDSPGKNTGVGKHSFFPGDLPNPEMNLGLLLCRQIPYYLSHQGSPGWIKCSYFLFLHYEDQNPLKNYFGSHFCIGIFCCTYYLAWCLYLSLVKEEDDLQYYLVLFQLVANHTMSYHQN